MRMCRLAVGQFPASYPCEAGSCWPSNRLRAQAIPALRASVSDCSSDSICCCHHRARLHPRLLRRHAAVVRSRKFRRGFVALVDDRQLSARRAWHSWGANLRPWRRRNIPNVGWFRSCCGHRGALADHCIHRNTFTQEVAGGCPGSLSFLLKAKPGKIARSRRGGEPGPPPFSSNHVAMVAREPAKSRPPATSGGPALKPPQQGATLRRPDSAPIGRSGSRNRSPGWGTVRHHHPAAASREGPRETRKECPIKLL